MDMIDKVVELSEASSKSKFWLFILNIVFPMFQMIQNAETIELDHKLLIW